MTNNVSPEVTSNLPLAVTSSNTAAVTIMFITATIPAETIILTPSMSSICCPTGVVSTAAVYMTSEHFDEDTTPLAALLLKQGSYVDDLINSVHDKTATVKLTSDTEAMLLKGGFRIKFWLYSGDKPPSEDGTDAVRVLGLCWKPEMIYHGNVHPSDVLVSLSFANDIYFRMHEETLLF